MITIVTSLITSVIVSLLTFVTGLKAGKMQLDRAKKQQLYKQLYICFSEMEERLKENYPLKWNSYTKGNTPLVKMVQNGDSVFLKPEIVNQCIEVQKKGLQLGGNLTYDYDKKLFETLAQIIPFLKSTSKVKNEQFIEQRTYISDGSKLGTSSSYRYSFINLVLVDDFRKMFEVKDESKQYEIEFHDSDNPKTYHFAIYKDAMPDDKNPMLRQLSTELEKLNIREEYMSRKEDSLKDLKALVSVLKRRTKDPDSFWEIFSGAFTDIFKK